MGKPNKRRYKLSQVKPAYNEALGTDNGMVELEGEGGEVFTFTHPIFMDDEAQGRLDGVEGDRDTVRELLGAEQFEKFEADGNKVGDFMLFFAALGREASESTKRVRLTRS